MSGILVPTDFSENSKNALRYALEIQKSLDVSITLLHTYEIPYTAGMDTHPGLYYREMSKAMEERAGLEMTAFLDSINKDYPEAGKYGLTTALAEGNLADVVADWCKEKAVDMVIMGTLGASGLKEVFIGSNTSKVISNSKINVLAVPSQARFNGVSYITYASDFQVADVMVLSDLLEFAEVFNAKVRCVHVNTDPEEESIDDFFMEELEGLFEDEIRAHKTIPEFYLVKGKNALTGILEFLRENPSDILAVYPQDYSLLEKIFHRSLTKQLAHHSNTPLLVIGKIDKT